MRSPPITAARDPRRERNSTLAQALLWAAGGTGFTALLTALGAATVFFFRSRPDPTVHRIFLGFAAGVMIAASMWSLLIPAIEEAEAMGMVGWVPAAGGSVLGIAFLLAMDALLPQLTPESFRHLGRRTPLLVLAVTLHNIPEGMAVGLAFSMAAQDTGSGALAGAVALAIGMGLQNFPEGAAISLPLRSDGVGTGRAFAAGALSGVVEPIFGLLTVLVAGSVSLVMPWVLSFAAGAMIYVVVEELIPEAHLGEHSHVGTASVMCGFLVMMLLDVMLG